MHPKALLESATELLQQVLRFDQPADAVVSRFFREHRSLGPRERATLAETAYAVLRRKLFFDHLAPSGSGSKFRRLAILGFQAPREFLDGALDPQEKRWLDGCLTVDPKTLLDRHRHNLPDWLVQPAEDQGRDQLWAPAGRPEEPAP